jgi:hypothetical protein
MEDIKKETENKKEGIIVILTNNIETEQENELF